MKQEEPIPKSDEKIGHAMVKAHILSDNQLKTAFDYQRSLGGSLAEVVVKLGFSRPPAMARFLAEYAGSNGGGPVHAEAEPPEGRSEEVSPDREAPVQPPADPVPKAPKETPPPVGLRKGASRPAAMEVDVGEDGSEPATESPPPPEKEVAAAPSGSDPILEALIQLLIKKGVFRRRDLEDILRAQVEKQSA